MRKTWSFHVVAWQRTATKYTKTYNARAQLLFCIYSLLSFPHTFLLYIFRLIFLYHLLYFISYLIDAHVLIPACFFNKLIHFCRINKVIIIIIIIIIIKPFVWRRSRCRCRRDLFKFPNGLKTEKFNSFDDHDRKKFFLLRTRMPRPLTLIRFKKIW